MRAVALVVSLHPDPDMFDRVEIWAVGWPVNHQGTWEMLHHILPRRFGGMGWGIILLQHPVRVLRLEFAEEEECVADRKPILILPQPGQPLSQIKEVPLVTPARQAQNTHLSVGPLTDLCGILRVLAWQNSDIPAPRGR